MSEKYWNAHAAQILDGKRKTVLESLDAVKKSRKPRGRGFLAVPKQEHSLDFVEQLKRSLADLNSANETKVKKEHSMDDTRSLTDIDRMIANLVNRTRGLDKEIGDLSSLPAEVAREKQLFSLGMAFLDAAEFGDWPLGKAYIDEGFDVNFQHPTKKQTALHISTAVDAIEFTDILLDSGKCNFLLKDAKGRLVYDIAYKFGRCSSQCHEIKNKTLEQAAITGEDIQLYSVLDDLRR